MRKEFTKQMLVSAPAREVFDWHARPGALDRLQPPREEVRVLERTGGIEDVGSTVVLESRLGPLPQRWVAKPGSPNIEPSIPDWRALCEACWGGEARHVVDTGCRGE